MRRGLWILSLAIAGSAQAGPAPATRLTWADWVGDWEGKLKW
jgi:hypothetical protein